MYGKYEDTVSQPARVREALRVDRYWKLLPVGSHIHAVSQQSIPPTISVFGYERQPERANTLGKLREDWLCPGEILADFEQPCEVPAPTSDHL